MKLANLTINVLIISFLALLFQACSNPQKMIYRGEYDAVVSKLSHKFKKSLKRKPEDVTYLEQSFAKANERDLNEVERLKAENNDANWQRINSIYQQINGRQELLRPLLPIKDDNGRTASIQFAATENAERESRQKAAEFHYTRASQMLAEARQNTNRLKAREAYAEFGKIAQFDANYKDHAKLRAEAKTFGTVHILGTVTNSSNTTISLPSDFADSLFYDFRSDEWTVLHTAPRSGTVYNYDLIFNLNAVMLSEIAKKEQTFQRDTTITDTVRTANGNTTSPLRVQATVVQFQQRQNAQMAGGWQVIDKANGAILCGQNLNASYTHTHISASYTGDRRALSREQMAYTNNSRLFPTQNSMIHRTAAQLRQEIARQCNWRKP